MSSSARRGVCLVISAPSGAGKSSIAQALRASERDLTLSISATTRQPRPGEQDGVHYHFRTQAEFAAMVAQGAMLEWATVFGNSYGTPRAAVETALMGGRDVLFDIDWQGHRQLRNALPADVISVFILPPSMPALEARLRRRGGDDPRVVAQRMQAARDEISHWAEFDHVVINASLPEATEEVRAVLRASRTARTRQPGLADFVASL